MNKNKYNQIHTWLRNKYGNATKCSFCQTKIAKRYEWALKKGCVYEKKKSSFIELCPSCHRKYDMTDELRLKHSRRMKMMLKEGMIKNPNRNNGGGKGGSHNSAKKIIDTVTGVIYGTVYEAAEKNNLKVSTLSMMLRGYNRNKTNLIYYEN